MTIRLIRRIVDQLDFTFADEALLALVDMVKCPLGLDTADEMIIFNNHCYDHTLFEILRRQAVDSNVSFTNSGYQRDDRRCSSMKDPRTGEVFEYSVAMQNLYFKNTVSRYKLKRIISSRVAGLSVPESEHFIPGNSLVIKINDFVKCIMRKYGDRVTQIEIYQDFLKMRQIAAQSTLQAQVTLPHSWVEPPFPGLPPPPPAPVVTNPNPIARLLVVNDDISISSDSSTASDNDTGIRQIPYGSPSRGRLIQDADGDEGAKLGDGDEEAEFDEPEPEENEPLQQQDTVITQPSPGDDDELQVLPEPPAPIVIATTQPSPANGDVPPNQPVPASVQADKMNDEEIDLVLISVLQSDGSCPAPEPEPETVIQQVVAPAGNENDNIQNQLRSSSRQKTKTPLPSFILTREGEQLCLSLLSLARADGFDVSLVYGKRAIWFESKIPTFFEADGIFASYRKSAIN